MTTKKYLSQVRDTEMKIRLMNAEIDHRRLMVQGISSPMLTSERVQSSGSYDKIADQIVDILEREKELVETIQKYDELRDRIVSEIQQIDNPMYFNVLYGKYVAGMSLSAIGDCVDRKERRMISIHGYALVAFEKKFGESYKNL